jgi:hypothetical protein
MSNTLSPLVAPLIGAMCFCASVPASLAATAPSWMRAQLNAAVPSHDDKADAVILYQETVLTVSSNGKIKRLDRQAFRILRPGGQARAKPRFYFDPKSPITDLHGWSIPPDGKDYEVKERDAIDSAVIDVDGGELVSDLRMKLLPIPGAQVGAVVGYEVEQELKPEILADDWDVQDIVPIREEKFTLILPAGWSYESNWLNHGVQAPSSVGANQWSWTLNDVAAVKIEPYMPPWQGIAGRMVVSLIPPGGKNSAKSWNDIGAWYTQLTGDRRIASPAIKQKVAELTANARTTLAKIQALAKFVQTDIRYVAIELGIGGHQPHPAADIFKNRYGDCKDNVTLLSTMLKEVGVDSYYVIINTERGAISSGTPPNLKFNHVILAIALPADVDAAALPAHLSHPKWGQLLFFDPTDTFTPFGSLRGELQANFALLVAQGGGELLPLPQLSPELSGVTRIAKMELDENGTLQGEVSEVHVGGSGAQQRALLRSAQRDTDQIKPIEKLAGASLSNFQVLRASIANLHAEDRPFEWHYSLQVDNYSKAAGELILLRPRLLGNEAAGFLETKEARAHPIEFDVPERDSDTVEILLPAGYSIDELPPPTNIDDGFASYHSKTEFSGRTLKYSRTLEIKELSVPASKAEQLKAFYRDIAGDERNSAVLKRASR